MSRLKTHNTFPEIYFIIIIAIIAIFVIAIGTITTIITADTNQDECRDAGGIPLRVHGGGVFCADKNFEIGLD